MDILYISIIFVGVFLFYYKNKSYKNSINKLEVELRLQVQSIINADKKLKKITEDHANAEYQISVLKSIKKRIEELSKRNSELERGFEEKDKLFELLKNKTEENISRITSIYADFLLLQYDISSRYLKSKSHPALKEAKRIDELKNETKIHVERYKKMLYKYEVLLQLFPELVNYVDDFDTIMQLESINDLNQLQEEYDRVLNYISKEEYLKLSVSERNQIALDNYISGQKSKWQIGRDYELFCGMQYEQKGWDVEYIGIEKKINDMGRDLIAKSKNIHHVIQCKYWSQDKFIHEKHITQLFGTTVEYGLDKDKDLQIIPVFITNISLSDTAKIFAKKLNVKVIDKFKLENFPRIKCNVGRDEYGIESKIYHLPFDQQYDKTKINSEGEFYAYTVEEAVSKGFRRALKYYGGK